MIDRLHPSRTPRSLLLAVIGAVSLITCVPSGDDAPPTFEHPREVIEHPVVRDTLSSLGLYDDFAPCTAGLQFVSLEGVWDPTGVIVRATYPEYVGVVNDAGQIHRVCNWRSWPMTDGSTVTMADFINEYSFGQGEGTSSYWVDCHQEIDGLKAIGMVVVVHDVKENGCEGVVAGLVKFFYNEATGNNERMTEVDINIWTSDAECGQPGDYQVWNETAGEPAWEYLGEDCSMPYEDTQCGPSYYASYEGSCWRFNGCGSPSAEVDHCTGTQQCHQVDGPELPGQCVNVPGETPMELGPESVGLDNQCADSTNDLMKTQLYVEGDELVVSVAASPGYEFDTAGDHAMFVQLQGVDGEEIRTYGAAGTSSGTVTCVVWDENGDYLSGSNVCPTDPGGPSALIFEFRFPAAAVNEWEQLSGSPLLRMMVFTNDYCATTCQYCDETTGWFLNPF